MLPLPPEASTTAIRMMSFIVGPIVQKMTQDFLNGNRSINPNEALAFGCHSIHGAGRSSHSHDERASRLFQFFVVSQHVALIRFFFSQREGVLLPSRNDQLISCTFIQIGMKLSPFIPTIFIQNHFHPKTTFTPKPLSSKTTFIPNHFHPKPLSSHTPNPNPNPHT